jgi:two-component system sensor histidine kinase GlrK
VISLARWNPGYPEKRYDAMKFFRPKSILHLILLGFLLVALPLIVGLVFATISVDRLVNQSQETLLQSVFITQSSYALIKDVTAMERNAKQYQVLGDKVLFDVYVEKHTRFLETANSLDDLELARSQRKQLAKLRRDANEIHAALREYPYDAQEITAVLPLFSKLAKTAELIRIDSQDLINRGVELIQGRAGKVQRTLVFQAVALVPAALLLTGLFAILITRPIKQVDHAIRQLGDGKFTDPAIVTGPRDLEQLGERLNWLRNRLLELEQDKTRFLQHISHELKTPLSNIREGAELMNEQVIGELNNPQQEIVDILRDNSLQLQKLIEDLLNFSILRARASQLSYEQVELKNIIEQVLDDHKVTLLSRQLDLRTSLQAVSITGDAEKLRILVDNLISNAIKYSPDNSPLWVLLSSRDSQAIIEVTDCGPGILATEHERIFEAFFQGKPATRGHVRGTGLGLSIAREYARAHGGNITVVDSTRTGARLRVILPLEQGSLTE